MSHDKNKYKDTTAFSVNCPITSGQFTNILLLFRLTVSGRVETLWVNIDIRVLVLYTYNVSYFHYNGEDYCLINSTKVSR
jgi:hypothetical protein